MPDDEIVEETVIDAPGWQVLSPDGTVINSGPGIVLEMVAHTGEDE